VATVVSGFARALRAYAPWVAFAFGALHSLAFAPFEIAPLGPLCIAVLWWLWRGERPRRAAWIGFAFGAGLFLSGTYWLYTSIHGFGKAPIALAVFLMLGLVAIMGTYSALVGWLVARSGGTGYWRSLALLPGAWVLMEWFRGWFLSGFPWLAVGYSQIDTPLAGYAPVAGIYGLSLITAFTAGALLAVVEGVGLRRFLPVGAALLLWCAGIGLMRVEWTRPAGAAVSVALVQGAIPQDQKWQEDNREHTLQVYRAMTDEALGARIIVWPEAALPMLYHEVVPYLTGIYRSAQSRGSDLVLGLLRYDPELAHFRNGLVALSAANEAWYYKRRLVPFGEFFPVPTFIRSWMRLQSLAYVDFSPGDRDQGTLDAGGQKLGATICYEDAYAVEQLAVLKDATLLVNVSNDAWFGDSTAPHQHLQITRMRALEAGRWLIRATNNGVSAIIDSKGRVVARTHQFVPEVLKGDVIPLTGLTPYAVLRNWPALGLGVLLVLAALYRRRTAPAMGS
jgi:apolipoprotein N-acyltransferase